MENLQQGERSLDISQAQAQILSQGDNRYDSGHLQLRRHCKETRRKWTGFVIIFLLISAVAFYIFFPLAKQPSTAEAFSLETKTENTINSAVEDSLLSRQQVSIEKQQSVEEGQNEQNDQKENINMGEKVGEFPRILWVQTDHVMEAKRMEEIMMAQNLAHFGKEAGFEVRIVNNLNAYDWLSEQTIAYVLDTHTNSKVELPVLELFRLALLYEHGGVSIRLPNIMLLEGLGWVEDLMRGEETFRDALSCQLPDPDVIVIHEHKDGLWERDDAVWYKDDFIAARPRARLLKVLMGVIQNIVKDGVWPFLNYEITKIQQETEVPRFPNMAETLINIFHRQDSNLCSNFGLESFHANSSGFMLAVNDSLAAAAINMNEGAFEQTYGKRRLLRLNTFAVANDIVAAFKAEPNDGDSLLKTKLISAEGNRWLTEPKRQTRDVQLCIVSLAPIPAEGFEQPLTEQLRRLARQNFANWNLVTFVEGLSAVSKTAGKKVVLVNASAYEGLNLQRAATKYCDPSAVMLLLDLDEVLASDRDLETLAEHFTPIGVFAAFFKLKTLDNVVQASGAIRKDIVRKTNDPDKEVVSDVGNLLRAFLVETYRFVPAFDLYHSRSGRYFDREIALMGVLELGQRFSPCEKGNIAYKARRLERLMTIPREKVFTNITINTTRFKTADLTKHEYFAKFRQHEICDIIIFSETQYTPVEELLVLNDGREDGGLAARNGKPELIPRKIHQIWVKGEVPNFKRYLMARAREAHPDYEYFLWGEANFTRENFPESYEVIQALMEFDKRSRFNKMAMVADIIRNQIAYRHGGFYLDTNFLLFGERPLDQFLTFELVTAGEVSPQHRVLRDQAFFGCSQHSPRFARIVSRRVLASRNHYALNAARETGPGLFGKVLLGKEELDEDILQPGFEEFYPNFIYDTPKNYNRNKCIAPKNVSEGEVMFVTNQRRYLKNCSEIYSYAYGMDFLEEGGSWVIPRWRS